MEHVYEFMRKREDEESQINRVLTGKAVNSNYSKHLDKQLNDAKKKIKELMVDVEEVLLSYASQLSMKLYSTECIEKEKAHELQARLPNRDEINKLCNELMITFDNNVHNGIRSKIDSVQMEYNTLSTEKIGTSGNNIDASYVGDDYMPLEECV
jgi:hypothetical protein